MEDLEVHVEQLTTKVEERKEGRNVVHVVSSNQLTRTMIKRRRVRGVVEEGKGKEHTISFAD